jgi:putative IMPACT (imprinted ancient) family translation regulator
LERDRIPTSVLFYSLVKTLEYKDRANIFDEAVKSRHSRLSGIVVFYNVLKKDDSGQAGMTSKEGNSTFYENIIFI